MEDAVEQKLEGDIKREFQLERMILFSDAVFAIVITLMAIEIKVPESEKKYTSEEFLHHFKMLIPTIIAYVVSFVFIGLTWYRHLQIFGKLKDYDKGLIICNLVLLFFIGLFPFGASLVSRPNSIILPYALYFIIVFASIMAQHILIYYIYHHPSLLSALPTRTEKQKLRIGFITLCCFAAAMITAGVLFSVIDNPEFKTLPMVILLIVPIVKNYLEKKEKRRNA
jgi:uncharacterized membrane protein